MTDIDQYFSLHKPKPNQRVNTQSILHEDSMRGLSPSELQFVSGASGTTGAIMRALGAASSGIGYTNGVRLLPILGAIEDQGSGTANGAAFSGILASVTTHAVWDDPTQRLEERLALGMALGFLCGAGVGVTEGLFTTVMETLTNH